jgi:hypothetical protein
VGLILPPSRIPRAAYRPPVHYVLEKSVTLLQSDRPNVVSKPGFCTQGYKLPGMGVKTTQE